MSRTEEVFLDRRVKLPDTYACDCFYCQQYKGMLIRPGTPKTKAHFYNRNERRDYMLYKHGGGGAQHINPTPLHIARWGVQSLTEKGDIVIDPFTGTGTTAVEAMNHGRGFVGTEIDTIDVARINVENNWQQFASKQTRRPDHGHIKVYHDDARNLWKHLRGISAQLMVLHPPYSGDEQSNAKYDKSVDRNLAFLKESDEYWRIMSTIFEHGVNALKTGGWAIIGVKEMMKAKKWWDLHIKYSNILMELDMEYRGMVLLPHYPRTLHLNTYYNRYGIHPSYYQTVTMFKKVN